MGEAFAAAPGAFLLRYGSVLALFIIVLLFARHRWAKGAEARRLRGVLLSALVTVLGFLLYFGGPLLILVPIVFILAGHIIFLYLVLPAFVAAALADLVFRALGAERILFWLGVGIVAAVAITIIWTSLIFGGTQFFMGLPILEYGVAALVPVSTALIWWCYLPMAPDNYAETFE
jgi:hypothetical protein